MDRRQQTHTLIAAVTRSIALLAPGVVTGVLLTLLLIAISRIEEQISRELRGLLLVGEAHAHGLLHLKQLAEARGRRQGRMAVALAAAIAVAAAVAVAAVVATTDSSAALGIDDVHRRHPHACRAWAVLHLVRVRIRVSG